MEEVNWSSLHKILSDTTRRNILELLAEREALTYTEIMALLRVTNTGKLNYHLKALVGLVSKDDQGRYHLTEKGQAAVKLLQTFPERISVEHPLVRTLKTVIAAALVLGGIVLICSGLFLLAAFPAPATTGNGMHMSIGNQVIPENMTVSLVSCYVQSDTSPLNIAWSASSAVDIYVINSTQHDALLLQHAVGGQVPTTREFLWDATVMGESVRPSDWKCFSKLASRALLLSRRICCADSLGFFLPNSTSSDNWRFASASFRILARAVFRCAWSIDDSDRALDPRSARVAVA
jgi:DNA-binding transcriptional ArsR family regulator